MAQQKYTESVSIVHPVCCGLDVHKNKISSCLVYEQGGEVCIEIREFTAFTDDLIQLRDWLLEHQCPVVAMESTGIYWRPVHNILEGYLKVVLVNARHYKNVPGRKTDIGDSQWLAELLRYGLVKGSFIPPKEIRQWRDLTMQRKQYVLTEADFRRRVQKLFESANIKIDSIVSDLFGVSGRNLMSVLLSVSPEHISKEDIQACLRGSLVKKTDELFRSIQGFFTDHHRFILASYLDLIDVLRGKIDRINAHLSELMSKETQLLERIQEVPGIGPVAAATILSLIGTTMDTFSCAASLCSWAGLCPGNNESAGKRRSGRSPVRKHPLKEILVEVAWAAVKVNGSYYKDKYYRLKARRGAKRAIIGIAHRVLKAIFHIIKHEKHFHELGEEYLSKRNEKLQILRLKKMAERHGYELVAKAA
jgi:transposase